MKRGSVALPQFGRAGDCSHSGLQGGSHSSECCVVGLSQKRYRGWRVVVETGGRSGERRLAETLPLRGDPESPKGPGGPETGHQGRGDHVRLWGLTVPAA